MSVGHTKKDLLDYDGFVDKFKAKKTTDDCYTPPNIYDVVADYVTRTYGVRREDMVRPFWPGGDYERFDYPAGCCVVDNPPFSIITPICRELNSRHVRFFVFCPYLTAGGIVKRPRAGDGQPAKVRISGRSADGVEGRLVRDTPYAVQAGPPRLLHDHGSGRDARRGEGDIWGRLPA